MQVHIRPADLGDVLAMLGVTQLVHRTSYGTLIPAEYRAGFDARYGEAPAGRRHIITKLTQVFERPSWYALVAEIGNEIVGYSVVERANLVRLHGLFVKPQYQGLGVGTALFQASLKGLEHASIELLVLAGNHRAIRLYKKHGFRAIGYADVLYFGAQQMRMYRTPLTESNH